jgi:nitrogen fixation NifU-like protein
MSHPEPKLSSLYQEVILDHYKKPRNKGILEDSTVQVHMLNPSCGDEVRLQLKVENGIVEDVKFAGQGCSISQASISMMTALVKGKSTAEAQALAARFTEMMRGDEDASKDRVLGNLRALSGVSQFPVRTKCALLGFNALGEAIERSETTPTDDPIDETPESED